MYAFIPKIHSISYQSMFKVTTAKMAIGHTHCMMLGLTMQRAWYHKRGIYSEAIRQSRRVKEKQAKGKKAKKTIRISNSLSKELQSHTHRRYALHKSSAEIMPRLTLSLDLSTTLRIYQSVSKIIAH
jgi:hypothetical protein